MYTKATGSIPGRGTRSFQFVSGAYQASYPVGTGGSFSGREADPSPCSAEVTNSGDYEVYSFLDCNTV
jgi:hypothetical protein